MNYLSKLRILIILQFGFLGLGLYAGILDDVKGVARKGAKAMKVVNIVAGSETGSEVEVFVDTNTLDESKIGVDVKIIDGKSISTVKEERLYNLVDYKYDTWLLELRIKGKGFKINTFTFG